MLGWNRKRSEGKRNGPALHIDGRVTGNTRCWRQTIQGDRTIVTRSSPGWERYLSRATYQTGKTLHSHGTHISTSSLDLMENRVTGRLRSTCLIVDRGTRRYVAVSYWGGSIALKHGARVRYQRTGSDAIRCAFRSIDAFREKHSRLNCIATKRTPLSPPQNPTVFNDTSSVDDAAAVENFSKNSLKTRIRTPTADLIYPPR
jgi:hypothetical protein